MTIALFIVLAVVVIICGLGLALVTMPSYVPTPLGKPAERPAPGTATLRVVAASPHRPTLLVDFDGVCHRYSRGWADGSVYDPPMEGAREALEQLEDAGYEVVIFSTRAAPDIRRAFAEWGWPQRRITDRKLPAVAMIDDRAIRFESWSDALADVLRLYPIGDAR